MKSISRLISMILATNLMISSAAITPAAAAMSMAPTMAVLSEIGQTKPMDLSAQVKAKSDFAKQPLSFEANHGQTDASVKFLARGKGYTLFLTPAEAVLSLKTKTVSQAQGLDVLRISLKDSNADPMVQGLDILPGKSNYMTGNDQQKWHTNVEQYSKVAYKQVYPGIDMVYYGNEGQLEYDFVVAPGANPDVISMDFQGAKNLELDKQGNLVLSLKDNQLAFNAPVLYQKTGGVRQPVEGRFIIASNNQVRFEVGAYDKSKELIIDPSLTYSTYLGASVVDKVNAIVVDAAGYVYMTGQTQTVIDKFPGTGAYYQSSNNGGAFDAFVIKLNLDGTIMWATYYGGTGDDIGLGIGVDAAHNVYITGSMTGLLPSSTPSSTAFGTGIGTGTDTDAFIAAFTFDGTGLIYANQFGCPQDDSGNGIAVDAAGNAYVTGFTGSTANDSFPIYFAGAAKLWDSTVPAQAAYGLGGDAFVAKFDPDGVPVYSTYLGGTGIDSGNAIAIDSLGAAYITGNCGGAFVAAATYPNVFHKDTNYANDAFIVKLDPTGATFTYKTYVGGDGITVGNGIAVPTPDTVYITGYTNAGNFPDTGTSFPTVGQLTNGGAPDAFVFKLHMFQPGGGHADGVYATYLGGNGIDKTTAIAVDLAGNAYVTGTTESPNLVSVWPGTQPMLPYTDAARGGTSDAFVTVISPTGLNPRLFSTYLGGTTLEGATGLGLDAGNNIYVAGWTTSAGVYPTGFPTTSNAIQPANKGATDGFVMKISPVSAAALPAITSVTPNFGPNIVSTTTVVIFGTGFNGTNGLDGVQFGELNAVSYTVISSTMITAVAPKQSVVGTMDVRVKRLGVTTPIVRQIGIADDRYTYYGAPVVTGVYPPSGVTTGGTKVFIFGEFYNINVLNGLKFDVRDENFSVISSTQITNYTVNASTITITLTPAHAAGVVHIVATNPAGSSVSEVGVNFGNDTYTYSLAASTAAPTITKLNPTGGVPTGGTTVIINGTGFTGATSVNFGNLSATSYTVNTSTSITAVTPAHASGPVDVIATTLNGSSAINLNDKYTYFLAVSTVPAPAITGVKPAGGTLLGGTTVQITGTSFTGATKVTFDLINAASYTVNSSTSITAVTPAHAVGIVDIIVTTLNGASPIVSADNYTYFAVAAIPPSITSISPTLGLTDGGQTVVITGLGFSGANPVTGANGVKFGEVNASTYTVNSNTQITAVTAAHIAGVVDVVATSLNGSSAIVPEDAYTYYAAAVLAPTITSLNPPLGTSLGGTTVVITGTGFNSVAGANGVKFDNLNVGANYVVNSDNQITVLLTPAHAVGIVDVVVTSLSGASAIVPEDKFTYFLTPVAAGYFEPYIFPSPTTGSTAGIAYFMASAGMVNIRVYNEIGNLMYERADERKSAGPQGSRIDVGRLAPGVYLYLLKMKYDDGSTEKFSKRKFVVKH